ncbi:MAG TPA: FtsK/SpoIIIE domain-containing protein, partial [Thermoanaerobaculia bacterium]
RGYSHVFVSGPSDGAECSDFVQVAECEGAFQEVYSRAKTRALVLAYANGGTPDAIRASVADVTVLSDRPYHPITQVTPIAHVRNRTVVEPPQPAASPSTNAAAAAPAPSPATAPIDIPRSEGSSLYPEVEALVRSHETTRTTSDTEEAWLATTVARARAALQQFQLNSKVIGEARLTPNALIVRFQGAANMTVELVQRRRSEFLTTHGLDLIAIRGEPGVVALSIARPVRQVLHSLDIWKRWEMKATEGNHRLLVAVREEDSELLFVSPSEHAPHTLIAGMTGSGKSVLMQNIILSIACTNTVEQAKIVLIDPKLGVDYFAFEGLPHIDGGIIEDQSAAIAQLNALVTEMDRRYGVLKANKCSNIFELNRKQIATERFPVLWVIHDEFAEWMMTDHYRDTVTTVVSRLGVKARAAGIFLVFAAQRPDSNVMPMQLRANLGNRLILRVDSEGTSEIALGGDKGAERLLGRGHMLAKLEGQPGLIYSQVPMIGNDDIRRVVDAIRRGPEPT